MPNALSYLILFGWPVVVLVLFRRMPVPAAFAWSIVAGYLLLPGRTGINLPMVPTIDKDGVPALAAAVISLLVVGSAAGAVRRPPALPRNIGQHPDTTGELATRPAPSALRGGLILWTLLAVMLLSPVMTVLRNGDPVFSSSGYIAGLRIYDAFSMIGGLLIGVLPFLLARRFLASPESHVVLLRVLCLAALGYSLLALWEVRFSPQLNVKIYGFFPHAFGQHMRAGGFRPVIFLQHGLWVGVFIAMGVLSLAALWRQRRQEGATAFKWLLATFYLLFVLLLSKNTGALSLSVLLLPCVLFLGVRGQLIVAATIASMILLYPMLRGAGWIPTERVHSIALAYSAERAESLQFRFSNEDKLLAKANQKPLAGWGSWGRNRVYTERGADESVTDGMWIILIGVYGWLGYIAQFGLITLPVVLLVRHSRNLSLATSGLALALCANLVDLIPNATLTPLTWLIGGALMGRYAAVRAGDAPSAKTVQNIRRRISSNSRSPREVPLPVVSSGTTGSGGLLATEGPRLSRRAPRNAPQRLTDDLI